MDSVFVSWGIKVVFLAIAVHSAYRCLKCIFEGNSWGAILPSLCFAFCVAPFLKGPN